MILSLSGQAWLFLTTVALGFLIGFFYDIIRIFRQAIYHSRLLIQAEDGIYWIVVIYLMFTFMLRENFGEIRLFSVLGALIGMALYFSTLSRLVMGISSAVIRELKYFFRKVFKTLSAPFRMFLASVKEPALKAGKIYKNKAKRVLLFSRRYVKMNEYKLKKQLRIITKKI